MSKEKQTVNRNIEKGNETEEVPLLSRRYKIRMNRFFRERVRGSYLPYPEVDNFFERTRSRLFVKLKKMRRK